MTYAMAIATIFSNECVPDVLAFYRGKATTASVERPKRSQQRDHAGVTEAGGCEMQRRVRVNALCRRPVEPPSLRLHLTLFGKEYTLLLGKIKTKKETHPIPVQGSGREIPVATSCEQAVLSLATLSDHLGHFFYFAEKLNSFLWGAQNAQMKPLL